MQITTAAQAASRDADAIASGIDSWTLMHAAGTAAAVMIAEIATRRGAQTVFVWVGTGNNGGDGYVVAEYLCKKLAIPVVVHEIGEPRTSDAQRARDLYLQARANTPSPPAIVNAAEYRPMVLVDAVLGTGQQGALRSAVRELCAHIPAFRASGGVVVALDVPTGVNATTGEIVDHALRADYTLSFGTMKRAHILQREQCGEVVVVDIGLGRFAQKDDGAWELADRAMLRARVPAISWQAHKGARGRVAIVGGSKGMAGAVVFAAEAALRSGAGLVFAHVAAESVLPLQITVPQAMAHAVESTTIGERLHGIHAVVVGPGFGRSAESIALLHAVIAALINEHPTIPLVLDADALTLIATDSVRLNSLSSSRTVICTPHLGEFERLIGRPAAATLVDRVAQAQELVARTGCSILLKGTPTIVIAHGTNSVVVVPRGTSVLATGGSGDMLSGMIGTLLAQGADGENAGAIAAWVHGRAAELAVERAGSVRGVTLREVLAAMPEAWRELAQPIAVSSAHSAELTRLPRVWSDPVA